MSKSKEMGLITHTEVDDAFDCPFKNDIERIKYVSKAYKDMSVAKAFSEFYGLKLPTEIKTNYAVNSVTSIELGKVYNGIVKEFNRQYIEFEIPGIKEKLICKENFTTCIDNVQNFILMHDNKLLFEVRERRQDTYYVSVINAYYKLWMSTINKAIEHEDGIHVHIDDLVRGGYICHTAITHLNQLTGRNYTSSVFIPGSHIVLNIEHDFEKWIGQDVLIVPQKFVEFKKDMRTGIVENSLVGSRKRVLQIMGMQNMSDIYKMHQLANSANVKATATKPSYEGTVTGIINSNKKTGIFIELDGLYITGLMPTQASELLDYKPGDKVSVRIHEFEVQDGREPFITTRKGQVVKCNVRPVFELA